MIGSINSSDRAASTDSNEIPVLSCHWRGIRYMQVRAHAPVVHGRVGADGLAVDERLHHPGRLRGRVAVGQRPRPGQRAGVGGQVDAAARESRAGEPALEPLGRGAQLVVAARDHRLRDRQAEALDELDERRLVVQTREGRKIRGEHLRRRREGRRGGPRGRRPPRTRGRSRRSRSRRRSARARRRSRRCARAVTRRRSAPPGTSSGSPVNARSRRRRRPRALSRPARAPTRARTASSSS